jgi:hypothetical protein
MQRKSGLPIAGALARATPSCFGYVAGAALPLAGLAAFAVPSTASGSIIAAYNFGATSTTFTGAATTLAANVTASGIETAGDFGSAVTFSTDAGQTANYYTTDPGGGPNMLSVESSQSTTDDNFWIEIIVTPTAGYQINPASFELYGGAGGGSNVRTAYVYDSVDDALTPNITPVSSGSPTGTNTVANPLMGSGNFTATPSIRSSSDPQTEITANLSADASQTGSYIVRIYFDTQGNVSKNIDLGYLELDGTVTAVPEPAALASVASLAGMFALGGRRRRRAAVNG